MKGPLRQFNGDDDMSALIPNLVKICSLLSSRMTYTAKRYKSQVIYPRFCALVTLDII